MKVWKIKYHQDDTPSGWGVEWFATKAKATARYNELDAGFLEGNGVTNLNKPERVSVPTKKDEMIRFLNGLEA